MSDWHYHANHVDAPARGSKGAAMKDAKTMHVAYQEDGWRVDPLVSSETISAHGVEFPQIVRCSDGDCQVVR